MRISRSFLSVVFAIALLLSVFSEACKRTPVKKKYPEVVYPTAHYKEISSDTVPFCFDMSDQVHFSVQHPARDTYFCNLVYPRMNACIYGTYHLILKHNFRQLAEESHRLVYQHTAVATGITEKLFSNEAHQVYGIFYLLQGNVATPIQFSLTDSVHYFFHGSLYFNTVPNADSIAPAVKYIQQDIVRLMETFKNNR